MRSGIAQCCNLDAVTDAIVIDVDIVDNSVAIVVETVADLGRWGALADATALAVYRSTVPTCYAIRRAATGRGANIGSRAERNTDSAWAARIVGTPIST
jgi:hypothetical protein